MPLLDVVQWTRMVGAYTSQGLHRKALQVFHCMLLEGVQPDLVAFLPVLEACAALTLLREGALLHDCVREVHPELPTVIGNSLINMYGKCGSSVKAQEVFDQLQLKNVISWTALFAAYGQNGEADRALEIYHCMQLEGVRPSRISFVTVLNTCESSIGVQEGRKIHESVKEAGCETELVMGNAIVNMYGKCRRPEEAAEMFNRMPERDVVTWTAMVSGYAERGRISDVIHTMQEMQAEGVKPNQVTFVTVLNVCEKPASLSLGRKVHALVVESGLESDLIVGNATVNMYGKCGSVEDAHRVFNKMSTRDVITWNAIISAYAHLVHDREPLKLFRRMEEEKVSPNKVTYVVLLYACSRLKALEEGKSLHARVVEAGLSSDVVVGTALVNLYAKCGELSEARAVFESIRREDVICWNSIIGAYVEAEDQSEALKLLERMETEGMTPDDVTYITILNSLDWLQQGKIIHEMIRKSRVKGAAVETAVLNMYMRCGSLEDAEKVFSEMEEHDIVSWTSMIMGYYQEKRAPQALAAFRRMQLSGVKPDRAVLVLIFKLCSVSELLHHGKTIHASLTGSILEEGTEVWNTVIKMYGKCQSVKEARNVFDSMTYRDSSSWWAILVTYSQHGEHREVLALFERQEEETRTRVGYVCAIIACGSLGALSKGRRIHEQVERAELQSDGMVGSALIDMYGKCGSLKEARSVFDGITGMQRDLVVFTSMMVVYARNGEGKEALEIFWLLQQEGVEPDDVVFVAVLSACSSLGLADEGLDYFTSLREDYGVRATKQHVGCLVDMLGRAGRLDEAEKVMGEVDPVQSDSVMWMSILDGCWTQSDVERGVRVVESILDTEPSHPAAYVVLSNMHKTLQLTL